MRKHWILASLLSLLILTPSVAAATATPSANTDQDTPTPTKPQQIEELKERLATKVAQMRQSEKRAIFGTIKSTSISSLVLETTTKDIKIELDDAIKVAQIIKGKRTELTIDDVDTGDVVTVFGDYDPTVDLLKAKIIFIQGTLPLRVIGNITAVDKNNYTLTLVNPNNQAFIIDIETDTKILAWTADKGLARSGFSKTGAGDTVQVLALPEPKQTTRVSARRILNLGNLVNPTPTPTPTPEASPSATPKETVSPTP